MFSLNAFLPPLLGGFIFVNLFFPVAFWVRRQEGYKLVFAASIAGGVSFAAAHLLSTTFDNSLVFGDALQWWEARFPFPFAGTSTLAFLLAVVAWAPLNVISELISLNRTRVIESYIRGRRDPLELILMESLRSQTPVSVTLKTAKVYVGRVESIVDPSQALRSIRLVLERSGYRHSDTQKLVLDIDYAKTHAELLNAIEQSYVKKIRSYIAANPEADEDEIFRAVYGRIDTTAPEIEDFRAVLMVSEIVSVSPFDPSLFDEHFGGS